MQKPPFLKKGDTVGVLALAWKVAFEDLEAAIAFMETEWELKVVLGESLKTSYNQYAATDEVRARDFQQMLDNPSIKAIFSARGGYGSARILDQINFDAFLENPKWLIGFSDITAVLCHAFCLGVESIHGVMPKLFLQEGGAQSLESLKDLLFGKPISYQVPSHPMNRKGKAQGQLVGGNLALMVHLIGSRSEVNLSGKILFLEDVGEYHYALDRMMIQLKRTGQLAELAGLIVGHFSNLSDDPSIYGKTAYEIVEEAVAEYEYPRCYGFPVGHEPENWAMPVGRAMELTVLENLCMLEERIIE